MLTRMQATDVIRSSHDDYDEMLMVSIKINKEPFFFLSFWTDGRNGLFNAIELVITRNKPAFHIITHGKMVDVKGWGETG